MTPQELEFIESAKRVASELAQGAADRERTGTDPREELARLKAQGFMKIAIPKELGGYGLGFGAVTRIVREISAGDGPIGVLLGYHTIGLINLRREAAAVRERLLKEIAACDYLLAGVANPREKAIDGGFEGDTLVLNGTKSFCTGAAFADRLVIWANSKVDGQPVFAFVPAGRAGIRFNNDWDAVGLRRADSGSFTLDGLRVDRSEYELYDQSPTAGAAVALRTPVNHAIFSNFYLGFAQAALREAVAYNSAKMDSWTGEGAANDDPTIKLRVGELWSELQAAIALVDVVAGDVNQLIDAFPTFSDTQRGTTAVRVAAAKIHATKTSLRVTSEIFDIMGARSTSARYAFDRFWRDARTHTLHDPLAHKSVEVGSYVLNGEFPKVGYYS